MARPLSFRVVLLAVLLVPAVVLFGVSWCAQAQPSGDYSVKAWTCSKCGGKLGTGVQSPSYCHHCKSNLAPPRSGFGGSKSTRLPSSDASEDDSPVSIIAVVALVLLCAGGLGYFLWDDSIESPLE